MSAFVYVSPRFCLLLKNTSFRAATGEGVFDLRLLHDLALLLAAGLRPCLTIGITELDTLFLNLFSCGLLPKVGTLDEAETDVEDFVVETVFEVISPDLAMEEFAGEERRRLFVSDTDIGF